jgi:ATP-binding cassette, subfamily B, bacterial MsbA
MGPIRPSGYALTLGRSNAQPLPPSVSARLPARYAVMSGEMLDYLKRVLELTRSYRGRLALGLLCGFLSGALTPALGLSLKLAVDAVFGPSAAGPATSMLSAQAPSNNTTTNSVTQPAPKSKKKSLATGVLAHVQNKLDRLSAWFRPAGQPSPFRLVLVISLIPASMLVRSVLAYLNVYLLAWVGIRAANDLRVQLFDHLMNLDLRFFNRTSTGDLMQRFEGAMAVNSTIKDSFGVIIREPISIITVVISLIALAPLLSLFTLLVFPICLIPVVIFGRKFRKSGHGMHAKFANVQKVMHESFTGIRVIKGYNLESLQAGEFGKATAGVTSFFMRALRAGELPGPLIEFIGSIGVALVFAYYASSHEGAPVGNMLGFFFFVFSLYAPLKNLSRLQHQLLMARQSVDPVYELLSQQSHLPEPLHPKLLKAHGATIRLEDVSFSYGEKPVLRNINLTIKPGQLVALVGRTGSGKTSIANLLLRFYDPKSGAILIGDTDIREVASRELRQNIAIVTQETILFNDTIRQNIALGRPGATNKEIEEAAKHAYAHEFILEQQYKYDTWVGEKGVNVSGGQRQRIAIARAILKNAPILILDEATSALDTEAERIVQRALEALMQGRTTICIAHRLSTIQKADLIVVLDGGRVVETGTHEELIQSRGIYSKLYELQFETAGA